MPCKTSCVTNSALLLTPGWWRKGSKSQQIVFWQALGGRTHLPGSRGTAVTCLHDRLLLLLLLGCHRCSSGQTAAPCPAEGGLGPSRQASARDQPRGCSSRGHSSRCGCS